MKRIILAAFMLLNGIFISAQHQEISENPETYKGKQIQSEDSTSLLSAFKKGHFNGHFRYFFMSTQNQPGLTDYYANAAGGGLRFETAKFHGFQFAVSGFYTFNIGSSDLGKPDKITGQSNRYEITLFDIENPYNYKDIDRLEELYLKYNHQKSSIVFGRQLINTPFINLQDGRMRPTGVEGAWLEFNEIKKLSIEGGWLYSISPRGTTKWYDVGRSIGVYPTGLNINGSKSQYDSNLSSKGVFLFGTQYKLNKNIVFQGWNFFTENIFNSALFQTDFSLQLKHQNVLLASAQFIRQDALNNGGNELTSKSYFEKNGKSMAFGVKTGFKRNRFEINLNYNRITTHGRYLMPREWGRDPFFTFMPRERNEGFGDVHAIMGKLNYNFPKVRIKSSLSAGYFKLPDVKNFRLNKYGLPSYFQINSDVRYVFNKNLKGLEVQLLIVSKINNGETYNNKAYIINKVNMVLYNLVLNYHF